MESLRLFDKLKEVIIREFYDENEVDFPKRVLNFVKKEEVKGDKNRERILRLAANIENKSDYE